jgi:hypothetical protein
MTVKSLRKQLAAAIAMTLVATVALGSSTYAWFVNNTAVEATSVNLTAEAANTLLISETGAADWKTILDITGADLTAMVPVSTVGGTGISSLSFVKDIKWTTDATDSKDYATEFVPATTGDYYVRSFDIKSSLAGTQLYLDDKTTFTMGTGSNSEMLKAMRFAMIINDGTATPTTYIYQLANANASSSYDTSINNATAVNGLTKAIATATEYDTTTDPATVTTPATVGNISATNIATPGTTSVPLIAKATTPANGNTFVSTLNGADLLYTFANADDIVNITVYIWMEGCDYDCNSAVVSEITGQTLTANFGFAVANN